MKINVSKWAGVSLALSLLFLNSLSAGATTTVKDTKYQISNYFCKHPWLGLLSNEIHYGPITISEVNIHDGDKLAIAAPGEALRGSLRYKIDSKDLKMFHPYHLVVGIKGIGAQDCVTHTFGIADSSGKGSFTLTAPMKPGVYEVRFFYSEAPLCEQVRELWDSENLEPSSKATIGIIIVEDV